MPRPTLLIACPNLCLDRVLVVRGFAAGGVHRAESAVALASGKGLNVARAARVLGAEVTVVGVTGADAAGRSIRDGARAHGIRLHAIRVDGPSRVCTLIVHPGREETVINEPGPAVDAAAARRLLAALRAHRHRADAVVLAGSLPPGLPADFYAQAIHAVGHDRQAAVLLDAAGDALRLGLAARPAIVKVNRTELAEVTGRSLSSTADLLGAAADLAAIFGGHTVVTLGSGGAALITTTGRWLLRPPPVQPVNTIGAGDSLTAGLVVALLRGSALPEAVRAGMAAAAADVATLLPGTIDAAQVQKLLPQVAVRAMGEGPSPRA